MAFFNHQGGHRPVMNAYFRIIQPQEMCPIVPQLALPGLSQPLWDHGLS